MCAWLQGVSTVAIVNDFDGALVGTFSVSEVCSNAVTNCDSLSLSVLSLLPIPASRLVCSGNSSSL